MKVRPHTLCVRSPATLLGDGAAPLLLPPTSKQGPSCSFCPMLVAWGGALSIWSGTRSERKVCGWAPVAQQQRHEACGRVPGVPGTGSGLVAEAHSQGGRSHDVQAIFWVLAFLPCPCPLGS